MVAKLLVIVLALALPAGCTGQRALAGSPRAPAASTGVVTASPGPQPGANRVHTAVPLKQQITITTPADGVALSKGAPVRGSVAVTPAEQYLIYRVYDAQGNVIGRGPLPVSGAPGRRGIFGGAVNFAPPADGSTGRLEVLDTGTTDGSVAGSAWIDVGFGKPLPAPAFKRGRVVIDTLPGTTLYSEDQIRGRVTSAPFEHRLTFRVYDFGGNLLSAGPVAVEGEPGRPGTFAVPIAFTIQEALTGRVEILEISATDGRTLAAADLNVTLAAGDAPQGQDRRSVP